MQISLFVYDLNNDLLPKSFRNLLSKNCLARHNNNIIIIMAGMALFYVTGYLIEERRRWHIITASPRGQ